MAINLQDFMLDVHQNAEEHGWWDEERSDATIRALFHCELSEAMEEYRANRPMIWHTCPYHPGVCENQDVHEDGMHCEACKPEKRKPEGIAVELIDFVIRVLDYLEKRSYDFADDCRTLDALSRNTVHKYWLEHDDYSDVLSFNLPDFVDVLHTEVVLSGLMYNGDAYLVDAIGLVFAWLEHRGIIVENVLIEKHEYNRTRPYKHGGKMC